jgi:hypothetical protein
MREAQGNLAIRWVAGFGLNDRLPDHSSLTRIRQRRDEAEEAGVRGTAAPPNERFRRIFERTVTACVASGIAKGEIVHVDTSLIRADVAWESRAVRHVGAVAEANGNARPEPGEDRALRGSRKTGKFKKVCLTDPDASMATSGRNRRLEPSYRQHGVVDDQLGVVPGVEITTGEVNGGEQMLARLAAAATVTGAPIATVTASVTHGRAARATPKAPRAASYTTTRDTNERGHVRPARSDRWRSGPHPENRPWTRRAGKAPAEGHRGCATVAPTAAGCSR